MCRSMEAERISDALELQLQAVVRFLNWIWALNSGPLKECQMLITTEPSVQPQNHLSYTSTDGYSAGPLTEMSCLKTGFQKPGIRASFIKCLSYFDYAILKCSQ